MAHDGRQRDDHPSSSWSGARQYYRHSEHDLPPLPADNPRLNGHYPPTPSNYTSTYPDYPERDHRPSSAAESPGRRFLPSPTGHVSTHERRPSGSVPTWDRHRPVSPTSSVTGSYSRPDPPLSRSSTMYSTGRHAWEDGRTSGDVSAVSRDPYRDQPPASDFREPSASHTRYPPLSHSTVPSPVRTSHLPPAGSPWTPGDSHDWRDPRDHGTTGRAPATIDWDRTIDRRKPPAWADDRLIDGPAPAPSSRIWERGSIRDPSQQRLPPPPDTAIDSRWRREPDPYVTHPSRMLPEPTSGFRTPVSPHQTFPPRAYDRPFDSVNRTGSYGSPASHASSHSFHDRQGGPPEPASRTHARSVSGNVQADDRYPPDAYRASDLREVKREPTDEPGELRPAPSIARQSTGSSQGHSSYVSILPPLTSSHSALPAPTRAPRPASPRYHHLPPLRTDTLRSITPQTVYPSPSARPVTQRQYPPHDPPRPQYSPTGVAALPPFRQWDRPPASPERPRLPEKVHADIRSAVPPREVLNDNDNAMEIDEVLPEPQGDRIQVDDEALPNEQPRMDETGPGDEDEPTRPPSDAEEQPQRAPRRSARKRAPARNRRPANGDAMDVDSWPFTETTLAVHPKVVEYLANTKRFEEDVDDLVEDIISQNRQNVDGPHTRLRTTVEELVDEINHNEETAQLVKTYCETTRERLAEQVERTVEEAGEKVARLREEYRRLNRAWQARCAELDKQLNAEQQKTPAPPTPSTELVHMALAQGYSVGRTTRRATAGNNGAILADVVRSDLEFEQVMASLGNEDLVDPNILSIRNAASIPNMLSVCPAPTPLLTVQYDDLNGIIDYPEQFYDVSLSLGDWTDAEKATFLDQFAINGKAFGKIADHLPNKTAEQCVLFYYISKHTIYNFREVAARGVKGKRKRGGARRGALGGKQKGNALLTDIRTRMGEDTPLDSPNASPKNTDAELPQASRKRRNGDVASTAAEDLRRSARRARRRPSPENSDETPARESNDEGSSSDGETDNNAEAPAQEEENRTRKGRRTIRKPAPITTPAGESTSEPTAAPVKKKPRASSHWSTLEKRTFAEELAKHGKNWEAIAAAIRTKSATQCKNYFTSNVTDLGLDVILAKWEAKNKEREEAEAINGAPTIRQSGRLAAAHHASATPPIRGPTPVAGATPARDQEMVVDPPASTQQSGHRLQESQPALSQPLPSTANGMFIAEHPGPQAERPPSRPSSTFTLPQRPAADLRTNGSTRPSTYEQHQQQRSRPPSALGSHSLPDGNFNTFPHGRATLPPQPQPQPNNNPFPPNHRPVSPGIIREEPVFRVLTDFKHFQPVTTDWRRAPPPQPTSPNLTRQDARSPPRPVQYAEVRGPHRDFAPYPSTRPPPPPPPQTSMPNPLSLQTLPPFGSKPNPVQQHVRKPSTPSVTQLSPVSASDNMNDIN